MPLDEYKKKRKFDKTSEPTGGVPGEQTLKFVVQKHAASHLHYDFRLELRGVLKSWAVPKGPSLDPEEKRLAMMTEDHPYDYLYFEGIIPKGQYGGGTVIVWDEGTYTTPEIKDTHKTSQEHSITSQFYSGGILLHLNGKKLKGTFAIIKAKDNRPNAWYLLKVQDKHATKTDVTKKDKSVLSNLTIEQMAGNTNAKKWQSNRAPKEVIEQEELESTEVDSTLLKQGVKSAMPTSISPMNATLIREVFNSEDWVYEVKLDGYRIVALVKDGKVTLQSRGGLNYTKKYPVIIEELGKLQHNAVLDGELCALDENDKPSFDVLQKYKGTVPLVYYVFDVLWLDGYDVTGLPLMERKSLLTQIMPASDVIKYSDHFEDGEALLEQVKQMGLEGIVCKQKDSKYQQDKRSKDWLKLPTEIRQEFVIGGWTESESNRYFRSLLFGAYEGGKLMFIGHAGGGFKDKQMPQILAKMKKHEIKKKPFANEVDHETKPHWIDPVLVGNFKFATWTSSGKIRKPAIFLGFRNDKDAKEVVREIPLTEKQEEQIVRVKSTLAHTAKSIKTATKKQPPTVVQTSDDSNWPELEKQEITSRVNFNIDGKNVELTNVEKELWAGVPKAKLIEYYHSVAPYILPYLKDRGQSLHIKNIKPTAPGMYIKDMEGRQPEWATIFTTSRKHKKKGKRDVIDYLVCNDEATLLYMVNLGCIDINPWTSRITSYQQPDFIIIDLDPSDDDFKKVIATAQAAKEVFDSYRLKAFPKTSGKTGIHLYIPCRGFTFPQARTIAEHICRKIHELVPAITTTEVTIAHRGDKLYIDPNQNDEADTVAAPYCVRPNKLPTVSTPLEWKEINDKLDPANFQISNMLQRIEKKGDLFIKALDEKTATANSRLLQQFL